ncbi:hypothetical protein BN1723_001922 [Verticillium longisporum]|uniref:Uncharacterized protein n=1 Tax=Verticillium longisporum TaxID=100787 RepID=A0A0G4KTA0_VERLO|nr:hypothetical protein BN1723_001922 [Verticillium longisporum]
MRHHIKHRVSDRHGRDGLDDFEASNRLGVTRMELDSICDRGQGVDCGPSLGFEARDQPARYLGRRVVQFAVVNLGALDQAFVDGPGVVGGDCTSRAVVKDNLQLRQYGGSRSPDITAAALETDTSLEPTLGNADAETIVPRRKKIRHVMCLVNQLVVIGRPARREKVIADPPPVDLSLIHAQRRDVKPRRLHRRVKRKVLPEEILGQGRLNVVAGPRRRDQLPRPVSPMQESRLKDSGIAPGGVSLLSLLAGAHADAASRAGGQRLLERPGHEAGFWGDDLDAAEVVDLGADDAFNPDLVFFLREVVRGLCEAP